MILFWIFSFGVLAMTTLFCFVPTQSTDIFLYLALGREYFRTKMIPEIDPFLYSIQNYKWEVSHEWISNNLFYILYASGGWVLVTVFKTLIILVMLGLPVYVAAKRKYYTPLVPAIILLGIFAALPRFTERVSIFTEVFFMGLLFLTLYKPQDVYEKVWKYPLLFLLWVNLHPGWIFGVVLLCAFLFCDLVTLRKISVHMKRLAVGIILSVTALLINPKGLEGALFPFRFLAGQGVGFRQFTYELLPTLHAQFINQTFFYAFSALILSTCLIFFFLRKRATLFEWFIFCFLLVMGFYAVRFVSMATYGLVFLAVHILSKNPFKDEGSVWIRGVKYSSMGFVGYYMAFVTYVSFTNSMIGFGPSKDFFPTENMTKIESLPEDVHLFHADFLGAYLTWNWDQRRKIFFHGAVTDFEFYKDNYLAAYESPEGANRVIEKFKIKAFLLSNLQPNTRLEGFLLARPQEWALVGKDAATQLFVSTELLKKY